MPKLPLISGKTAIKIFTKIGYQVVRQKGSHVRLHHPSKRPFEKIIKRFRIISRRVSKITQEINF